MPLQTVLTELFGTWLNKVRGLHQIVLCDSVGIPIISAGNIAEHNDVSLSAATSAIQGISENFKVTFRNSSVEYVMVKMRGRKVMIWKLPTQNMYVLLYMSSPTVGTQRKMIKAIDYLVQLC